MYRSVVAAAALVVAVAAPWSGPVAAEERKPEPEKGVLDGEVAVIGWPLAAGSVDAYLDPAGYELHLTPADDLGRESVHPAGAWFKPPKGRYRAWLEGHGKMSDTVTILSYGGGPFRGKGMVFADPVSPAGTVALDPAVSSTATTELRLLHLESHARGSFPRFEMARWLRGAAAHRGASMPEGRVLPSLFDTNTGEYVALGRPVEVRSGQRAVVAPRPPARGTSDLVVVLERPSPLSSHEQADVALLLRSGEEVQPPDEIVRAATRFIAVWYGVASRTASLETTSARVHLDPIELRLRPGRVERVSAILRKRPDLAVELSLPEGLRGKSTTLEVRTSGDDELVSAESFPEAPPRHRFTSLPPEELVVSLSVPPWRFLERVSLADTEDEQVYFSPEAIELEGTVFRGDEEVSAEIAFQINGTEEMLPVATDEDGNYEVVLFKPVSALSITLREREVASFLDYLIPPISASGRHDFHLPDNRFEVEVTDSESGGPIEGALVHIQNSAASGFGFNVSTQTDEEGVALLPPLREGSLSFSASAEGYAPTAEPVTEEIDQDDSGRRLALTLSPQGERGVLRLLLPSGLPAAGASACVKRTVDDDFQRWCGTGGEDGHVEVPRSALPGVILARHEAAGFLVAEIQQLPRELRLPERSGVPLGVEATDGFGKPVRWADVALFVDERKLTGTTLGWLTGSPAATDRDGFWRAPNVPAESVAVLVSRVDARERAKAGDLDHLRRDVPYPWRGTVEVFAEQ